MFLHFFMVSLWAVAILLSFAGYGQLFLKALRIEGGPMKNWALQSCCGVGVVLTIGGVLLLLGIATLPVLFLLVLVGIASLVCNQWREVRTFPRFRYGEDWVLWALLALILFVSTLWRFQMNPNDDFITYLVFPERILQTGALYDPFGLRRALVLGGHSFLQAMVLIMGDSRSSFVVDKGFGMVLFFGLFASLLEGRGWVFRVLRFSLLALILFLPVPRIHTGSHLLGAAMLLALIMTLRVMWAELPTVRWGMLSAAAILVAGMATFRSTFAVAGPLLVIGFAIAGSLSLRQWKPTLGSLVGVGALSCLVLLPWMGGQFISSGNLIFPLSAGNGDVAFVFGGTQNGVWGDFLGAAHHFYHTPILMLMAAIGLIVCLRGAGLRFALAISVPTMFLVWYSAWKMPGAAIYDYYRYVFPLLLPVACWMIAQALVAGRWKTYVGVVILAGGFVWANFTWLRWEVVAVGASAVNVLSSPPPFPTGSETAMTLAAMQRAVPAGAKIFAAVDAPYEMDFTRNPIFTADIPGACSPKDSNGQRMPVSGDPEALRSYLKDIGAEYLLAVDFNDAQMMYARRYWTNNPRQEWFFKTIWAPPILGFMDGVDGIFAESDNVGREGNLRLIKL